MVENNQTSSLNDCCKRYLFYHCWEHKCMNKVCYKRIEKYFSDKTMRCNLNNRNFVSICRVPLDSIDDVHVKYSDQFVEPFSIPKGVPTDDRKDKKDDHHHEKKDDKKHEEKRKDEPNKKLSKAEINAILFGTFGAIVALILLYCCCYPGKKGKKSKSKTSKMRRSSSGRRSKSKK